MHKKRGFQSHLAPVEDTADDTDGQGYEEIGENGGQPALTSLPASKTFTS